MKKLFHFAVRGPLKRVWHKLIHINDTPEKIAMGFAVGAFVGVFPTFWLGGIFIVALCWLFRLNYTSAIIGSVVIMNPLTTPFFWGLSAAVGGLIFSQDVRLILDAIRDKTIFRQLDDIALMYLVGNLVVSVVVSVISYYLLRNVIRGVRLKRERK